MTYRGRVQNGVVVIEGGAVLPEGTMVTIVAPAVSPGTGGTESVYNLGDLAIATGVSDLAQNIDHYLYGHPKVSDA